MDNHRVTITPRAGSDMEGIYGRIAADSPDNAAQMIRRILGAIEPLKRLPRRHVVERQAPALRYPVRDLVVEPYLIYFRVLEAQKVVRVLHGVRRQPRRFEK